MKLPHQATDFYLWFRQITPENFKPTLRGYYNGLNRLLTYGKWDIFSAIDIETISKCNIRCHYCPIATIQRSVIEMPTETFHSIIDSLARINYAGRLSPHFYSEPLIDPRLPELITYARKKLPRTKILVYTNAILLNREIFAKLRDAGFNGFIITRHTVLSPAVEEFFRSLKKNEKKFFKFISLKKVKLFNRGGLVKINNAKRLKTCHYVTDEIAINSSGDVVCTNDYLAQNPFGNINQESLTSIWHKPKFIAFRQLARHGKFTLEMCKKCSGRH